MYCNCFHFFIFYHTPYCTRWLSPTLARLLSPDSPLPLSSSQASWVASFSNVSRFFGAIVGAVLANWIGCKRTIFATLLPIALGWFCVIEATSVEWLYACRLFLGAGLGMMFSSFPTYVGEVSLPEIRGAIISSASVGSAFGTVVSSVCGPYLSLPAGSAIYFGLAVLLMFLFFWMPESPHHLMKVGDRKGAEKSIRWYRNGHEVEKELEAVEAFVKGSTDQSFLEKLMEFKTPPVRKATFQIIALFSFMQICGLNSIIFYMEIILRNAKFTLFDPASVVIYVNSAGILAAIVSLSLIDRCGRKFLIIISSLGVCISMGGLSSHFFFIDMGKDVSDLQWLPMAAMFLFVIAYFLGLMCVPSTILSETFPANIKCIAACIGSMTAALTSFISTKTYQPLVDTIGETYVFLMYSVCAAIVIPYTVFFMRETKGKTLMQIQEDLRGK